MTPDRPLPDADDIAAVLAFLPRFEDPGFVFQTSLPMVEDPPGHFTGGWPAWSDEALAFVQTLYDRGFIRPFDWGAWQPEAERLVADADALAAADLDTLCRLLTTHVRKDRFCEGHLAWVFAEGHVTAILRRLAVLARGA